MTKKDLGLLVLIIVVGAVVALINPRFLLPINLANTANLVGMFGLSALGQAFVIVTGGIELSVGSVIALTGVLFVDLVANQNVPWPIAVGLMLVLGAVIGLAHGLLITKLNMQPFVVTLCGLLIYRGFARFYTGDSTAGFGFGHQPGQGAPVRPADVRVGEENIARRLRPRFHRREALFQGPELSGPPFRQRGAR